MFNIDETNDQDEADYQDNQIVEEEEEREMVSLEDAPKFVPEIPLAIGEIMKSVDFMSSAVPDFTTATIVQSKFTSKCLSSTDPSTLIFKWGWFLFNALQLWVRGGGLTQ